MKVGLFAVLVNLILIYVTNGWWLLVLIVWAILKLIKSN